MKYLKKCLSNYCFDCPDYTSVCDISREDQPRFIHDEILKIKEFMIKEIGDSITNDTEISNRIINKWIDNNACLFRTEWIKKNK